MVLNPQTMLLLSLANAFMLAYVVRCAWQQRSNRKLSETSLRYTAYRQADLVIFAEGHQQILEAQEMLESTIHGTTATVRAIHLGIAAIPFGILEAIPVTRNTTKVVRGTHNLISDAVYSSISVANRASGVAIRKGIGEIEQQPDPTISDPAITDPSIIDPTVVDQATHSIDNTASKPADEPSKKPAKPPSN